MLDQDWPGFFRQHILESLPVDKLAFCFPEKMGRPTKELYTVLAALALQQYQDLTDQETSKQLSFDIQWHYALDLVEESDDAKYVCPNTHGEVFSLLTRPLIGDPDSNYSGTVRSSSHDRTGAE
ncbi:MAG: transposase [Desulfobacterales bacterium]|nr:transposase [Desulfobacterales bacterium]